MKLTSENLDIIKALEDNEPGKWLAGRNLKYLDIHNNKISLDAGFIEEDPELILRAIRLSGEIIMDIDTAALKTLREHSKSLKGIPRNILRNHFVGIITSNDAEKALKYLREIQGVIFLFGDSAYRTASGRIKEDIRTVMDNMNKARPEIEHRLTLLLRPLGKDGASQVLNHLIYDRKEGDKIVDAVATVDKLYFINTKMELKKFIKKFGFDNYTFMDKISRQEKKIFDRQDTKVEGRHYLLSEIKAYKEPLFIEELAIDEETLIKEGIANNTEEASNMLGMLLDSTFIKPRLNTEKGLIKKAKQLKRNPLSKYTAKIWWRK